MRSTVEALEGNKVKVVIEVEEAEFEKDLDAAFRRLAQEIRLPGFRPGKAPRKVLEARIGQSYARDEAFREALPTYYSEAVKEHEVDVIAPPEIDITDGHEAGPVSFDAVVEIRPSITVEAYDALEIELPAIEVESADVDDAVDRMREGFGELATVDRPGADGDSAVIDIEAFHDGEEVAGLTTDDYVYKIGSRAVVPEIDEHLTDASAGDELSFTAEYPDDEVEEPLELKISVKEIQETVLPEATDEWVADNSEFESVVELRADFEDKLRTARLNEARNARGVKIAEALADLVDDDDVPAALIDMEVENRAQDMAIRLQAQGIELQTFLSITGQTQEDFVAQLREQAERSARVDLALRAIAEAEELTVETDDLDAELDTIAEAIERPIDDVRTDFAESGRLPVLRSDILKRKANDWVTEHAKLVDSDGHVVSPDALELPDTAADVDEPADGQDRQETEPAADPAETGEDET